MKKPTHQTNKSLEADRTSRIYLIERGLSSPARIIPHIRRRLRNRDLKKKSGGKHQLFYRAVMDDVASTDPDLATGSQSREQWLQIGSIQFEDLLMRGLKSNNRLLEIGCGNLRAGWRIIQYLEPNLYVGVDVSASIVLAALKAVETFELQEKHPRIFLIEDNDLMFLPTNYFDVIHAHSVLTHVPPDVVSEILRGAARVMKDDGSFFATYFETQGGTTGAGFLDEDFYYSFDHLAELGWLHGLVASTVKDWEYPQHKIQFRHS